MQPKLLCRSALVLCTLTALFLFGGNVARAATTYYSQCTCDPNTPTNWNTVRTGGGSSPGGFNTAGDTFVIQDGHNMTTSAAWSVGASGSKLQIENGGTLTATSAVTVHSSTTFQIDNGGTYVHNNTTAFGSSVFQGTESFGSSSTVILNNSNTTGPSSVAFGNLTIDFTSDPGAVVNSSGGITLINGNLMVSSTSVREFRFTGNSALNLTIGGNLNVSGGTLNWASGTGSPTVNLAGNFNQTGGTIVSSGSVSSIIFTGGSSAVTFTQSAGTLTGTNINWQIANGKTVTFNNTFSIASLRSMTIDAGGALASAVGITNNGALLVNGTLQLNSGGFVSGTAPTYSTTSTLKYSCNCTYGRSLEWSATSGAGYPANVQISNNTILNYPNGSTAARSMSGNLTIDSGSALYMDYGSPSINNPLTVGGNLVLNGAMSLGDAIGGDLNLAGTWSNSGTFYPNNRAVNFNGSSAQAISGATTFDYLTVNNTNGLALNNNITINQTLTLTNGKLDTGSSILELVCSASVSGASVSKYILGNLKKNYCTTGSFTYPTGTTNGYSPVDVTLTALGTNPSSLQIKAVQSNLGGLADAKALDRYWTLTETGDLTADLTFNYLDGDVDGAESDYRAYRSTTDLCGSPCVNTATNQVSISNVSAFSNWSAGEGSAPTNIVLAAFKLKATTKPSVKVKWETGTELIVLGFNVYRATKLNGAYKLLTAEMIEPKSPGEIIGNKYTFTDKQVKRGKTYFYQLEVVKAGAPNEWSDSKKIKVP